MKTTIYVQTYVYIHIISGYVSYDSYSFLNWALGIAKVFLCIAAGRPRELELVTRKPRAVGNLDEVQGPKWDTYLIPQGNNPGASNNDPRSR